MHIDSEMLTLSLRRSTMSRRSGLTIVEPYPPHGPAMATDAIVSAGPRPPTFQLPPDREV
jgi:hypothetical protein